MRDHIIAASTFPDYDAWLSATIMAPNVEAIRHRIIVFIIDEIPSSYIEK